MNTTKRTVTTVRHEYVIDDYGADSVPMGEVSKAYTWAVNEWKEHVREKEGTLSPSPSDDTIRLRVSDGEVILFWEEEQ